MNRDHDHDIADLLVRERNSRDSQDWMPPDQARVNAVCSMLEQDAPIESPKLVKPFNPQPPPEPEIVDNIEACRSALWIAENEGQIDPDEFHRAHAWLDSMQKGYKGPCKSDLELIRQLLRHIGYHIDTTGCMVGDEHQINSTIAAAKQRLKEVYNADIHGDRVPEDRHCELLRTGQGDLDGPDNVDGKPENEFGWFGLPGR